MQLAQECLKKLKIKKNKIKKHQNKQSHNEFNTIYHLLSLFILLFIYFIFY